MTRVTPTPALLAVAVLIMPVLVLCAGCGGGNPETSTSGDGEAVADPAEGETEPEDASIAPLARRTVESYFPSAIEDGLVSEFREIFDTATPGDQIKQIVADLISGPTTDETLTLLSVIMSPDWVGSSLGVR